LPNHVETFEEHEQYLRGFTNFGGGPAPYDFGGAVTLMLALVNNLRENASATELEDLPKSLSDGESEFILQLAEYVRRHRRTG
jgi:hypothetical protein